MTTLKQIMNLVDAYGSERCSGNEYDNRYAEKRARDAVVSALKEYAPQRTWVNANTCGELVWCIDKSTMELAESVGLIGPASRTHNLHQAIQQFHDLICANATVKAARMAADAVRESASKPLTDKEIRIIGNSLPPEHQFHSRAFARAIEAAHGIKEKNTRNGDCL